MNCISVFLNSFTLDRIVIIHKRSRPNIPKIKQKERTVYKHLSIHECKVLRKRQLCKINIQQSILIIKMNEILINGLILLVQKVHISMVKSSFEDLLKISKKVSSQFIYYLKITKYAQIQSDNSCRAIEQLASFISTIINSIESKKYGQMFPYFQKVLKTCKSLHKINRDILQRKNTPQIASRHEINEKSEYLKQWATQQITRTETSFLHSENITPFFQQLANKEIHLQNPQCVCCSQVFIKKFLIINKNPIFTVISDMSDEKSFDKSNLENYFNAICNKSGGILIIGARKMSQGIKAEGIQFINQIQIEEKQNLIRQALVNVRNVRQFKIQRVCVHTNYIQPKDIHKQYLRICFRIFIAPSNPKKISYIESYGVGFNKIYQVYEFNENMVPIKIICEKNNQNSTKLYKAMHEKYFEWKQRQNSHKNIQCFLCHPFNSKLFYTALKTNEFQSQQSTSGQVDSDSTILNKDLKFKYENRVLIVISSAKQQKRIISTLETSLKSEKILFQIYKPYENDFKEGRFVWMLNFNSKLALLKNMWEIVQSQMPKNQGKPLLIPIYQTIEVDKDSIDDQSINYIKKRLNANFKDEYQSGTVTKLIKNQQKNLFYFRFENKSEPIFAFKLFEELGLIAYFTEDTNI